MKPPNFYSGILNVSTGILKENVYLVRNTCNLPEIFCKGFLLIFLLGIAEGLGFIPKSGLEACHHNFDTPWRELLNHFGILMLSKSNTRQWHRIMLSHPWSFRWPSQECSSVLIDFRCYNCKTTYSRQQKYSSTRDN